MFALYKLSDGKGAYRLWKEVAGRKGLGGGDGPLARLIREQPQPTEGSQTLYWDMEGSELLGRVLGNFRRDPEAVDQGQFKLVIDQNPNPSRKPGTDSYYFRLLEICHVCGASDPGWTPLMFRLREVFYADSPTEVEDFRKTHQFEPQDGGLIHEFLRLGLGWKTGGGGWGRGGSANGVLLWPDHLRFFMSRIDPYLGLAL